MTSSESASMSTIDVKASCHCKTHTYTFQIPTTALPLPGSHCHCNMCRHSTGVIFTSWVSLPQSIQQPYSKERPPPATLTAVKKNPPTEKYFCSKCGTHLFYHTIKNDKPYWAISAGALKKTGDGLVKYAFHEHVEVEAKQDGIALFNLVDDGLPCYATDETDGRPPLTEEEKSTLVEIVNQAPEQKTSEPSQTLKVSCHCGSVRALLSRPLAQPEDESSHRWLGSWSDSSRVKWKGSHCICESCRLSSGFPVNSWIFPSHAHVKWMQSPNPAPLSQGKSSLSEDYKAAAGMSSWRSRKDVERSFCATCGANVLYETDRRKGMYDLAVGLLVTSVEDGERMSDWVVWEDEVDFVQEKDDYDAQFGDALVSGLAKYCQRMKLRDG